MSGTVVGLILGFVFSAVFFAVLIGYAERPDCDHSAECPRHFPRLSSEESWDGTDNA